MDRTKEIRVICLHPDGEISLERIDLKLSIACSFEVPHTNTSQGPQFVQLPYTYVLHHNSTEKGQKNIYSERLLHLHCSCGREEHGTCCGKMYLTKHDPRKRKEHKFDFSQDIPFEEALEYDTHIDCQEEDIEFIRTQLEIEQIQYRVHNMSWAEWIFYQFGLLKIN